MRQHELNPGKSLQTQQSKDKSNHNQLKTIFQYLQEHVATASMAAAATGIPQKNICRYKRDLEKAGRLFEVRRGICQHTKFKAWYITTDPKKAPSHLKQLSLF